MDEVLERLTRNVDVVRARIAAAARHGGRSAEEITLVGVTKYVGAEITRLFPDAGCTVLGESRPQQLWQKAAEIDDPRIDWHLIGHLQRNKISRTLPIVACIQSADSVALLDQLQRHAKRLSVAPRVLLEVNISGDPEKHGFAPDAAGALAARLDAWHPVRFIGLMTMAARASDAESARADFAALRRLRDQMRAECAGSVDLSELSMGMSRDFETAIEEGATIVRVGSALLEGVPGG